LDEIIESGISSSGGMTGFHKETAKQEQHKPKHWIVIRVKE
jgi:hypothetical protein